MQNLIDFAIGLGMFLAFFGVILSYLMGHLAQYTNMLRSSEMRSLSLDAFKAFFENKGIPENWEESQVPPVQVGLINDLYRVIINVTETSGIDRGEIIVNFSYQFDPSCSLKAWNSTVIIYDSTYNPVEFKLYNQTFCSESFLNETVIALKTTLNAYQSKIFYLFFSPEKSVLPQSYPIQYVGTSGYAVQFYPQERIDMVSIGKLKALRQLDYKQVLQTFISGYKFRIEVDE